MAAQYIDLFLRHNAQISMALFGIRRRPAEVRQRIIAAVAVMRENAAALPEVPEELRAELQAALEEGLNLALAGSKASGRSIPMFLVFPDGFPAYVEPMGRFARSVVL